MKRKSIIQRSLIGIACVGFVLVNAANAADNKHKDSTEQWQSTPRPKVYFVEVTGSHIPQRVVLHGQQVNSGSPLRMIGRDELLRSGAVNVTGILAMDPSITFKRR